MVYLVAAAQLINGILWTKERFVFYFFIFLKKYVSKEMGMGKLVT